MEGIGRSHRPCVQLLIFYKPRKEKNRKLYSEREDGQNVAEHLIRPANDSASLGLMHIDIIHIDNGHKTNCIVMVTVDDFLMKTIRMRKKRKKKWMVL